MLLAIWGFVHAAQYLTVWSANLPEEARWYLARDGALGRLGLWAAIGVMVLAVLVLVPRRTAGRRACWPASPC